MVKFSVLWALALSAWLFAACDTMLPSGVPDDQTLDGTIDALSDEQMKQFERGDEEFRKVFVAGTGLGPAFVTGSCISCHAGDGKGHPFTTLTRFGQGDDTGNPFIGKGGPQLQNRALPGYTPESIPEGAPFSKFTPPANTGLGYLELVSDADILAIADPNDSNQDGISGTPNYSYLPDYVVISADAIPLNGKYITRFGKKAAAYDLFHQTVNAYNQDMGITSEFEPIDAYTLKPIEPEVSVNTVNDVVFYLQALKAPTRRNENDAAVQAGSTLFKNIGCENCHKETLKTKHSLLSGLSEQAFHPYTDLLLHDMGPKLDDGYTEGIAKTSEWRTPPLWGLGLSPQSQGGSYFLLHDGRATSIEEAILLHGGEGAASKAGYVALSANDKAAIISFLNSL